MFDETLWLGGLKPGDRAIVAGRWNDETVCVVERRTPSGRIVEFNPDGWERRRARISDKSRLLEPTPERLDKIRARALRLRLSKTNWSALDLARLEQIAAVLDAAQARSQAGGRDV